MPKGLRKNRHPAGMVGGVVALLGVLCAAEASAAGPPRVVQSALAIDAYTSDQLAMLHQCAAADAKNAGAYKAAATEYLDEVAPTTDRVDAILRTEATRAGQKSAYYILQATARGRTATSNAAKDIKSDPATYLIVCRGLPTLKRQHLVMFRPLREIMPIQMADLDNWK